MVAMKYETLFDGKQIPRLGLGTWKMGGNSRPDTSQDRETIRAIQYALELGYTHVDTAEGYGGGHTEELVGHAIREFDRKDLFITSKVSPSNLGYEDVFRALEGSLRRLGTGYLDLYLIHWPSSRIPLRETFRALNEIVGQGRVRYVGVSNFNLRQLREAESFSDNSLATDQVPYSLFEREYARNGVLEYCRAKEAVLTAYTPFEKGRVFRHPQVRQMASKYGATPSQIALYWLIQQPKVITIPMSTDEGHLRENLGSLELELSAEDLQRLNDLS